MESRPSRNLPLSTLHRMALAVPVVAAMTAGIVLAPLGDSVQAAGLALVPAVFGVTLLLDWLDTLAGRHEWVDRVFGTLFKVWDSGGAGYYGVMAVITFVRLEAASLRDAIAGAGSVRDFLVGEIQGFGLESVMNMVSAALWFMGWLGGYPMAGAALVLAATGVAYVLARWSWVPPAPPLSPPEGTA